MRRAIEIVHAWVTSEHLSEKAPAAQVQQFGTLEVIHMEASNEFPRNEETEELAQKLSEKYSKLP